MEFGVDDPNLTFQIRLTRAQFEEDVRDLLELFRKDVLNIFGTSFPRYAELFSDRTKFQVILVGGATLMPWVMTVVRELLPGSDLRHNVHPVAALATGACHAAAKHTDIEVDLWVSKREIWSDFVVGRAFSEMAEDAISHIFEEMPPEIARDDFTDTVRRVFRERWTREFADACSDSRGAMPQEATSVASEFSDYIAATVSAIASAALSRVLCDGFSTEGAISGSATDPSVIPRQTFWEKVKSSFFCEDPDYFFALATKARCDIGRAMFSHGGARKFSNAAARSFYMMDGELSHLGRWGELWPVSPDQLIRDVLNKYPLPDKAKQFLVAQYRFRDTSVKIDRMRKDLRDATWIFIIEALRARVDNEQLDTWERAPRGGQEGFITQTDFSNKLSPFFDARGDDLKFLSECYRASSRWWPLSRCNWEQLLKDLRYPVLLAEEVRKRE